jgi:antirestriction protein ArdC
MAKPKFEKFKQDEVKDQHQILTDRIIQKMEEAVQYETPWFKNTTTPPHNPVTKTHYKGINFISLLTAGFEDPRFYTYNNIQKLAEETGEKIHLKKGEKGLPVFKAMQKTFTSENKDTGEEKSFSIWRQVYAGTVFNATQIEGIAPLEVKHNSIMTVNEELSKIIESMVNLSGLQVEHHHKGQAFYVPSRDTMCLPHIEHFKSSQLYQRTAAHELGHATGHEKRLNRKLTGSFGSADYAYEELVAELSSYFMGAELGFEYDSRTHENHAAYLKSWLEALKNDKNLIFKASSAASKAVEYQINIKKEYYNELTPEEIAQRQEKVQAVNPDKIILESANDDAQVTQPKKLKFG